MPAHVPRRNFAKPFIVTVVAAAAASAACHETPVYDNPPRNPPPQEPLPAAEDASTSAASATTADAAAPAETRMWSLERSQNDTCTVQANGSGATSAYACPSEVTSYPATITRGDDGQCKVRVYSNPSCPPHVHCNPPPPRTVVVPCPK